MFEYGEAGQDRLAEIAKTGDLADRVTAAMRLVKSGGKYAQEATEMMDREFLGGPPPRFLSLDAE